MMAGQPSPSMDYKETLNRYLPALIAEGVATDGLTAVASAGTRAALAPSIAIRTAVVQANASNAGVVCIGGSGVVAAAASRTGIALGPGDSASFDIDTPAHLYVDAVTAADKVHWSFLR